MKGNLDSKSKKIKVMKKSEATNQLKIEILVQRIKDLSDKKEQFK